MRGAGGRAEASSDPLCQGCRGARSAIQAPFPPGGGALQAPFPLEAYRCDVVHYAAELCLKLLLLMVVAGSLRTCF